MSEPRSRLARIATGFATFWWDFLVGDTPEITLAVIVILGLVTLLSVVAHANVAAVVVLPTLVIVALALSVRRARRN